MKHKLSLLLTILCVAALLSGCGSKPDEVALELAEAVNAGDLEGALALFADDAVVTSVSPEPFTGKAEIQGWLEEMFADNFKLEARIEEVDQNRVTEHDTISMDSMSFYGIDTLTGRSEIYVEGGKISSLNFSFSDETLIDLQAAPFVAPEDLIGIWTVGTMMQINDDGTLRVASKLDDLDAPIDEAHPGSLEAWSYDGMVMTLEIIEAIGEGTDCAPGEVGTYYIRWAGEAGDRLKFKPIEDTCFTRLGGMQWGNWTPVSP
jgi:hypothetical protein